MKKVTILVVSVPVIFSLSLMAQAKEGDKSEANEKSEIVKKEKKNESPQTLLSLGEARHSGYGGPLVRFGKVGDQWQLFSGAQGGWIINDRFVLGLGGIGMSGPERKMEDITGIEDPDNRKFGMGYGGVLLEYYLFPKNLVHLSAGVLIGAGGGGLYTHVDEDEDHHHDFDPEDGDPFFVLEPELTLYVNVTDFFRIGIGGTYRYVKGMKVDSIEDRHLRGFSGSLILEFGAF